MHVCVPTMNDGAFCLYLTDMEEVASVFRSHPRKYSLHTTRSWEFAGVKEEGIKWNKEDLWLKSRYGEDVIVGMLDNGFNFLFNFNSPLSCDLCF